MPRHLRHRLTPTLTALLTTALASTTALTVGGVPASAHPSRLDPAAMAPGPSPRIPHIVGRSLRHGDRSFQVLRAELRTDLWRVRGGYVVIDMPRGTASSSRRFRVTSYRGDGSHTVIARPSWVDSAAVSPARTRLAWADVRADPGDERSVVKVVEAMTGKVRARRVFRSAEVRAVTGTRVLLSKPGSTWWWDYRRDRMGQVSSWQARFVDLSADRVSFATRKADLAGCGRVAPLSRPERTLWRTCRIEPRTWSPDGERSLNTWVYFDAAGTDRWVLRDGTTGERTARIVGRLSWQAVWEDNRHFLTLAQGEDGTAAIVRCTVTARCTRAGRTWRIPVNEDAYFVSPPVLLASS